MGLDQYLYADFVARKGTELYDLVERETGGYKYFAEEGYMYVGGWSWYREDSPERALYDTLSGMVGFTPHPDSPHFDLYQVGEEYHVRGVIYYWRKVNAIHQFFVEQAQGGRDECQYADVSRELLDALLGRAAAVGEDNSRAEELLPPQSGFFFGSTDLDEWYFSDLERTREELPEWIAQAEKAGAEGFGYHSSW